MKLATILCAFVLIAPYASRGNPVFVSQSATGADDGSSWEDAFVDLQSALTAAVGGDEIWVAAGAYTPSGPGGDQNATFQLKTGVALYGGFAAGEAYRSQRDVDVNVTTLSGDLNGDDIPGFGNQTDNSVHVVTGSGVDTTAVLDGFTITGGRTSFAFGGGMTNVNGSPTVRHCTFAANLAAFAHGAGMYNQDSSPVVDHCTFIGNWVHLGQGGGMYNTGASGPVVTDCSFILNTCVAGGSTEGAGAGISNWTTLPLTVRNCVFDGNRVQPFFMAGDPLTRGAGIHNFSPAMTVENCTFINNWAHAGAGIYTWDQATVINSVFWNNTVVSYPVQPPFEDGGYGAGIASTSAQADTTTLINCAFVNNHGAEGVGVITGWNHHTVVQNSILWGNTATGLEVPTVRAQLEGSADVFYSCVQGLLEQIPGEDPPDPADFPGSIDQDPLLIDAAQGDLHLDAASPCIDAGDNTAVPAAVAIDLDGHARVLCNVVDMGVYESGIGDADCDRDVDLFDFASWSACFTGPNNGPLAPGCESFDFEADGDVDMADYAAFQLAFTGVP